MPEKGTYGWLLNWLGGEREQSLADHTTARIDDIKVISVRLYNTDIMKFSPEDIIMLHAGGWITAKTKSRINAYLPKGVHLYERRGTWFLEDRKHNIVAFRSPTYIDAKDGLVLPAPWPSNNYAEVQEFPVYVGADGKEHGEY